MLANRHRKPKLERCRALLAAAPPPEKPAESVAAMVELLTGKDLTLCPFCEQGTMRVTGQLAPGLTATVLPSEWFANEYPKHREAIKRMAERARAVATEAEALPPELEP